MVKIIFFLLFGACLALAWLGPVGTGERGWLPTLALHFDGPWTLSRDIFVTASSGSHTRITGSSRPIHLGSRRELFLDRSLLDTTRHVSLQLQTPQVAEMSIDHTERSWEGSWSGQGPTILKDGTRYRMYYFCSPSRDGPETAGVVCYAESQDGIVWTRPDLRQVEIDGTWSNNVLLMPDPNFHYIRPFIDTRPGVPPAQRYKAVTASYLYTGDDGASWMSGLYILVSPDGLHWSKYSAVPFLPAQRYKGPHGKTNNPPTDYDGMNSMFWSEHEHLYVCYYRSWLRTPSGRLYRWVRRTTSPDLQKWTPSVLMDTGGRAPEHWYFHGTFPYFRAPHIYIAMPPVYMAEPHPDFPGPLDAGHSARSESRFAFTRGDRAYVRPFPDQRFITTGLANRDFLFPPDQTEWPVFAGRIGLSAVPTGPREMSIYLEQPGRIVRYTLRTDGFVALTSSGVGHATTRPVTFTGNTLETNFVTGRDGRVRVELQDTSGRPFPGFTLAEATPMRGDEISRTVTWGSRSDVGSLAGQPVQVRFELQNAKIFSFRFSGHTSR